MHYGHCDVENTDLASINNIDVVNNFHKFFARPFCHATLPKVSAYYL